jgi:hypothetical protein
MSGITFVSRSRAGAKHGMLLPLHFDPSPGPLTPQDPVQVLYYRDDPQLNTYDEGLLFLHEIDQYGRQGDVWDSWSGMPQFLGKGFTHLTLLGNSAHVRRGLRSVLAYNRDTGATKIFLLDSTGVNSLVSVTDTSVIPPPPFALRMPAPTLSPGLTSLIFRQSTPAGNWYIFTYDGATGAAGMHFWANGNWTNLLATPEALPSGLESLAFVELGVDIGRNTFLVAHRGGELLVFHVGNPPQFSLQLVRSGIAFAPGPYQLLSLGDFGAERHVLAYNPDDGKMRIDRLAFQLDTIVFTPITSGDWPVECLIGTVGRIVGSVNVATVPQIVLLYEISSGNTDYFRWVA